MTPPLTSHLRKDAENGGCLVDDGATVSNLVDQDGGKQRHKPRFRGAKPLKSRQVIAAKPPTEAPGHPDLFSVATYATPFAPERFQDIAKTATDGQALEIPTPREDPGFLGAYLQEHDQDTLSERGNLESKGGASAAASMCTPATSTPSRSRSGRRPAKRHHGASDDDEDDNEHGGGGRGGGDGNEREAEANYPYGCPYYAFDKQKHFRCRGSLLRNLPDVLHHMKRTHKPPGIFCDRCWKVFESDDQLGAHHRKGSSTQCPKQPFSRGWAREEDLQAVKHRPPKSTWRDVYNIIFPDTQRRQPTFCTASLQDVVDELSTFRQSRDYQGLNRAFGTCNKNLDYFWPTLRDHFVKHLARKASSLYPAQIYDKNHREGLNLDSSYFTQQAAIPQTAQDVFPEPAGLDGQSIFSHMPSHQGNGAFDSGMGPPPFSSQYLDPGQSSLSPGAQTCHFPALPMYGQVTTTPGLAPQTASQMFSPYLPSPQDTLARQATARPHFGMPTLLQTPPLNPFLPFQMLRTARESQTASPAMLIGSNSYGCDAFMGSDGWSASPSDSPDRHR